MQVDGRSRHPTCLLLEDLPRERTRLVVSGYWSRRPRWPRPMTSFLFLERSHWIMQTRQFANLKRRAEAGARAGVAARPRGRGGHHCASHRGRG